MNLCFGETNYMLYRYDKVVPVDISDNLDTDVCINKHTLRYNDAHFITLLEY